jgi:hypothetical protein
MVAMSTADDPDVTGQPLFDGTFSTEAVAAAGSALLDQLHAEAMATIAALAEHWDQPVDDTPAAEDDAPVSYEDPATWSVEDDDDQDDDQDEDDDEDDEVRVLQPFELPALPLPRRAAVATTDPVEEPVGDSAVDSIATDQFAVPAGAGDRRFVAA